MMKKIISSVSVLSKDHVNLYDKCGQTRSERAIKPFIVGRKNWYFSASPKGADSFCGIYSLIETAKANGLNPYDYLCYVFENAPLVKSIED